MIRVQTLLDIKFEAHQSRGLQCKPRDLPASPAALAGYADVRWESTTMITTHRENHYIRNEVRGTVTIRELLEYARHNVDAWISDPVLWDLTHAAVAEDDSDYDTIRAMIGKIHDLAEKRKGQRTTFVAPDPYTYGVLRTSLTIVKCVESRPVASIFSDIREAEAWLTDS